MGKADLHMHSHFSDGEWAPEKLVKAAKKAKLSTIALTDHDSTNGVEEARRAGAELGVDVIVGCELSTWAGYDLHVLAYGMDASHPGFRSMLERGQASRSERARAMIQRLDELGLPLETAHVFGLAGQGVVGRPHVARALLEVGHVRTIREAFDLYLGDGKPACVDKARLEPAHAIGVVHAAGGVAVAAHPGGYGGPELLEPLVEAGLDGVEVRHPLHGHNAEDAFHEFALHHELCRTGGSDFHGPRPGGTRAVGSVSIDESWVDELKGRIESRRAESSGAPMSTSEEKS